MALLGSRLGFVSERGKDGAAAEAGTSVTDEAVDEASIGSSGREGGEDGEAHGEQRNGAARHQTRLVQRRRSLALGGYRPW